MVMFVYSEGVGHVEEVQNSDLLQTCTSRREGVRVSINSLSLFWEASTCTSLDVSETRLVLARIIIQSGQHSR